MSDEEYDYGDVDISSGGEITPGIGCSFDKEDEEVFFREKEFEILDQKQLEKSQQEEVDNLKETLGLSLEKVRVLLRHFQWNSEKILNLFFERDRAFVLKKAGLTEEDEPADNGDGEEEFSCPLCVDDVPTNKTTMVSGCKHRFCNSCWKKYIELKIKEGLSKRIFCMGFKCSQAIDESIVSKFVSKEMRGKYLQKVMDSFVEDNPHIKWCPSTPSCGNAVRLKLAPTVPFEINCKCSHCFCFRCLQEPHLPATCSMFKEWQKKCKDDSETFNWIQSNTRDCPKCGKAIEKNGGCNHMSCPCGHHFCWVCLGDFDHKTYSHNCGRYKEDDSKEDARKSLQRYLHYFQHFQVHQESRKKENAIREQINEKISILYKLKPNSAWTEVSWIENGMDTLFQARRSLQYSYAFAYYLFDHQSANAVTEGCKKFTGKSLKIAQTLFEDAQQELENNTERLSGLLEVPVEKLAWEEAVKREVIGVTVLVDKRLQAMFDIIQSEFMDEDYFLPKPHSVISSGSKIQSTSFGYSSSAIKQAKEEEEEKKKKKKKKDSQNDDDFDLQLVIQQSLKEK